MNGTGVTPAVVAERWTGPGLRSQRVRRGLRAVDVAGVIGCSRETVTRIELQAYPSERDVRRYFDALLTIDLGKGAA